MIGIWLQKTHGYDRKSNNDNNHSCCCCRGKSNSNVMVIVDNVVELELIVMVLLEKYWNY